MTAGPGPYDVDTTYVHLDDDGSSVPLPGGEAFWEKLMAGKLPQLERGRLISHFVFDAAWPSWERHPAGDEIVVLLSGAVDFVLEAGGGEQVVSLGEPGSFVIVPRGVWHTARPTRRTSMLFITPGLGTENRPV